MHNLKHSSGSIHSILRAIARDCNGARIEIYEGPQPKDGDAPARGKFLGAPRFADPAFHPASNLQIIAFPIVDDANAAAAGTPNYFRVVGTDGDVIFDGSVGPEGSDSDMMFDLTEFQASGRIRINTFTYSMSK